MGRGYPSRKAVGATTMKEPNFLVCTIYADIEMNLQDLIGSLSEALGGEIVNNGQPYLNVDTTSRYEGAVRGEVVEIELNKNQAFDQIQRTQFPDGFLYFHLRIEIYTAKEQHSPAMINLVGDILLYLWSMNIPAVAACDFEEQLPSGGGYKSYTVPWVEK